MISHYKDLYHVFAIDLLGHGNSTKIIEMPNLVQEEKELLSSFFYTPIAMIRQIEQVLTMKKIEHANLLCWSLGGHFAYGIGAKNPALVSSIITIGAPPVKFDYHGLTKGFTPFFYEKLVPEWVKYPKHFTKVEAEMLHSQLGMKNQDLYLAKDFSGADPLMRKYLFAEILNSNKKHENFIELDAYHFIKNTSIPLLMMVGKNDLGINAEFFQECKILLNEQSRVEIIKDAPHALFRTNEALFIEKVDHFINFLHKIRSMEFS